jgi:hypothetical protein
LRYRFKKQGSFSIFCPTLSNGAGKTFYCAAALKLSAGALSFKAGKTFYAAAALKLSAGAFHFKAGKTFGSAGAEEKDAGKTFYAATALKLSAGAFHFKAGKTFGSAAAEEKYAGKIFSLAGLIFDAALPVCLKVGAVPNDLCYRLYKISYLRHYIFAEIIFAYRPIVPMGLKCHRYDLFIIRIDKRM